MFLSSCKILEFLSEFFSWILVKKANQIGNLFAGNRREYTLLSENQPPRNVIKKKKERIIFSHTSSKQTLEARKINLEGKNINDVRWMVLKILGETVYCVALIVINLKY